MSDISQLANYIPRFVRRWIADHRVSPNDFHIEEIHGALLFADISGFTELANRLAKRGPGRG